MILAITISSPRLNTVSLLPSRRIAAMATLLCAIASAQPAVPSPTVSATAYDPAPWLQDLDQSQQALATKYANLEWAVFEHETDLTALFSETRQRIESATNPAEARAAFDRLARKLGDGHVRFQWQSQQEPTQSPTADCASLGYDARMFGAPVAAFAPGFAPLVNSTSSEFPAGTLQVGAYKVAIIKIGIFTPQGIPALCKAALEALRISPDSPCDEACAERIAAWASDRMTNDFAAQLRALKATGATLLLVDVADNGGGTEWAEAAVRMVTAVQLRSESVGFVRGAHWIQAFKEKEAALRKAADTASAEDRSFLSALADRVATYRHQAETPCDSTAFWRGERPNCRWLGSGVFATGLLSADSAQVHGKSWASDVFTPAKFNYPEGVWRGPLIVLVNGSTGSAAEEFTAVLQDNHAAVVIGAPTGGAGCGHTNGGTPTTLNNSRAVFEVPDCARFRADGSNEVMGIQPDILIGLRSDDGVHRQAIRVKAKLPDAVTRALRLKN